MSAAPGTVLEILKATEGWFEQRGVDAPRRSAELLLGRVFGMPRLQLYLAHDRPVTEAEKAVLRPLVARRGKHEPLAYVLGDWEFYGHELEVTPAVLVPRPETEGLVDLALTALPAGSASRCVDLGTGSGALAIALALERPESHWTAVDVSGEALEVAQRNVARHGLEARVELVQGSYWEPLAGREPFDLLVSNPPYVDPERPELLADDVRAFEPGLALFTPPGEPGAAYTAIVAGVAEHLRPGATVLVETGLGAAEASEAALRASPDLESVELLPDFGDRPRYLRALRCGGS